MQVYNFDNPDQPFNDEDGKDEPLGEMEQQRKAGNEERHARSHAQKDVELDDEPRQSMRVPFPNALKRKVVKGRGNISSQDRYNDLYQLLSKVEINLPLLDTILNMPAY